MGRRAVPLLLVAVLSLVSPACGRFSAASSSDQAGGGSTTTVRYGTPGAASDVATPEPEATDRTSTTTSAVAADDRSGPTVPDDAPGTGAIDLRVVATNGTPRGGVPVHLDGPVQRTIVSEADGHVRATLPAGRYRAAAMVGCRGQIHVRRGGGADVGVAAADTAVGDLPVEAVPRYQPAAPVSYSGAASWRVGEVHRVSLRLVDGCGESPPPSPRDYAAARFVTNDVAEVVLPLSDAVAADGRVEVEVRCTGDDDLLLSLADAADPASGTPILTTELLGDQNPPFCVR